MIYTDNFQLGPSAYVASCMADLDSYGLLMRQNFNDAKFYWALFWLS